jgi:archaellum component FlaG (FlaF/FlaG flagellin family)
MVTWLFHTRKGRLTLLLLGVALLLCALSLLLPIYGQICEYNPYIDREKCSSGRLAIILFIRAAKFIDSFSGFVTAIAAAMLTAITIKLARLEAESGKTSRAELRTYLSAIAKGVTVAADGETLTVYVEIKNAGQTPAFNMVVPTGVIVLPPNERFQIGKIKISDEQIDTLPPVTLPKDGASVVVPTIQLSYADRIRFLSSSHRFYVFGLITYQDVFGDFQWTEFCAYLDFKRFVPFFDIAKSAPDEKVNVSFKVAEFGNDTSVNPRHAERMKAFYESLGK